MKHSLRRAAIAVSCACAMLTPCAHAIVGQPGTLDSSWNGGGKVITPIGNGDDSAQAMTLQPDGKVLVAGYCLNGSQYDFCTARYLASGMLDNTWNVTGNVITPVGGSDDFARAVTMQPDGKVLVAGYCLNGTQYDFCTVRYLLNGTLDLTWNVTGKVITPFGSSNDSAIAMTLQPDGKVLLAGNCFNGTNNDFCAVRYLVNGMLDPAWNGIGKVITNIGSSDDFARAVTLQPDGKVLVAGNCRNGGNNAFCVARYQANGMIDATWNSNGAVITPIGSSDDTATAMALQPDGKVLAAGYCLSGGSYNFCAARYLASGTLDTTWNGTGKVITPSGIGGDAATAMTLQPDGKVLLTGYCTNGSSVDFCATRYMTNGSLDLTWNSTGKVITPIGVGGDYAAAMTLQPDGKVLLAGYCDGGTNVDFCVARYDGGPFGYRNCSLDIDGDGSVLATTDSLIHTRIALGITGSAVVNGITFPPTATRNTWPLIRDYLVTQCGMSLVQ